MAELPTVEPESGAASLARTLRDVIRRAEMLGLSETVRILREAQEAADRAVTGERVGAMN